MKSISQSKIIGEKILKIISDVTMRYVDEFDLPQYKWQDKHRMIVFLNCDMEIMHYLGKLDMEIEESLYDVGLSFSALIIKHETSREFFKKFGEDVTISEKQQLYDLTHRSIYNFIINGLDGQ